ncbi:helix-turn-helix domain-containing protein [Nocardia rhizosphaerae]|uniref:Helix-turn-helix domain-containing protein n=1 Tax=Nocardia rhizosphaerae TaxID=1691571 RepID=A0ABV8LAU6_9NOCA
MPAASPVLGDPARADLAELGGILRARRQNLGISATAAAEAAGVSRVTLYRIERGEPSVTMGAYLNAISALGLRLDLGPPGPRQVQEAPGTPSRSDGTSTIRIGDYPQLRAITWQLAASTEVTPKEALNLYERNWRHVDHAAMDAREKDFVDYLVDTVGGGLLLV